MQRAHDISKHPRTTLGRGKGSEWMAKEGRNGRELFRCVASCSVDHESAGPSWRWHTTLLRAAQHQGNTSSRLPRLPTPLDCTLIHEVARADACYQPLSAPGERFASQQFPGRGNGWVRWHRTWQDVAPWTKKVGSSGAWAPTCFAFFEGCFLVVSAQHGACFLRRPLQLPVKFMQSCGWRSWGRAAVRLWPLNGHIRYIHMMPF